MSIFFTLVMLFALVMLGKSAIVLMRLEKLSPAFILGLSFGFGTSFIVLELLVFSFFNIPITRLTALLIPGAIVVSAVLVGWNRRSLPRRGIHLRLRGVNLILCCFILMLVLFVTTQALLRLPIGWDAVATWLMQAKGFYFSGGFTPSLYKQMQFDSPPAIGLLGAFFYTVMGGVYDRQFLLFFSFFYIANCFLLFGFVRSYTSKRNALIFVFLYASIQSVIRQAGRFDAGYADLPLSYFFLASSCLLQEYKEKQVGLYLLCGGFFAGMSVIVKNEGSVFFLFYLILSFVVTYRVKKRDLLLTTAGLAIFAVWNGYKVFFPLFPTFYSSGKLVLERFDIVMRYIFPEFFRIARWNLLWAVFFFTFALSWKQLVRFVPFLLFFLQLLSYIFIYFFTPLDPASHIEGSFDRLLLQITPLATVSIAIPAYVILKKQKAFRFLVSD